MRDAWSPASWQDRACPSRSWGRPCGPGGGNYGLRARQDSAAAFLLRRLGSLGQLFPLDGVPGDDPDAAASMEILSFEVTCADS